MRWFTLLLVGCVSVRASAADINVPADHSTIQAAIVAANTGDVVIVAPGTYPESLGDQHPSSVRLTSAGAGPPDGVVGIEEFLKVLSEWGACP